MKHHTIAELVAYEILDSRGNPTVEVVMTLADGSTGRASVPSGASTGSHEALELRDGDIARYGGKGVQKSVANVNTSISASLVGMAYDQHSLDAKLNALDGTKAKSVLGANAILGVSLAFAHAAAAADGVALYQYFNSLATRPVVLRLPMPMMNVLNGGAHAALSTDMQEFMIVPVGAKCFSDAVRMGAEVFHTLKSILASRGLGTSVGDEGGFAVAVARNEEALELIEHAITQAGYKPGSDIAIAIDAAASEWYADGTYRLMRDGLTFSTDELVAYYGAWLDRHPIVSIEDGLAEDDWEGFAQLTKTYGATTQLVGDDLFVTDTARLNKGIAAGAANAILIKPNQIGTVTETIAAIECAHAAGYRSIISHRSGETEDVTIAHLAVGLGTGQIKTGSLCRGERIAKYNELLRIEQTLGADALFVNPFER